MNQLSQLSQLLSVAAFEVRYHLRRPTTYVFMAAMFLLAFLFATTDAVQIGGVAGKIVINSPWAINTVVMILSLVGMVFTSAISGTAILRDFEFKSHELLFTTRLSKPSFVLGRFLGAYAVTVLVFAAVPLALGLATYWPWTDPDKLGPGGLANYLWPMLVYVLPNAMLACALFFAVGILTRSFVAVYVQGVALFVGYSIALSLLSDLDDETRAALVDPFGIIATNLVQRNWTVVEKNSLLLPLDGLLLLNRVLWVGAAMLVLAAAHRMFRMEAFVRGRRSKRRERAEAAAAELPEVSIQTSSTLPRATPQPIRKLAVLRALVVLYYRDIVSARIFKALVAIGIALTLSNARNADLLYGTSIYPVTYSMIDIIGSFGLLFIIITALYSGEMLWRERSLRCDQILDATPVPTDLVFVSKILAMVLVHARIIAILIGVGIAVQLLKGYHHLEIPVYLGFLYGFVLPSLVLTVLLAFFLHVLANNKFLGIVLVVLYYILTIVLALWGVDHRLYTFDGAPTPVYSAMNGFGPHVDAYYWFTAYYLAFVLLLLAFGHLLLVRGTVSGFRARMRAARARMTPRWFAFAGLCLLAWLGLGAFIHHNTDLLNVYRSADDRDALQAEFERDYKQYEHLPQPRVVASELTVDIFPERGHMRAKGIYKLVNRNAVNIEQVHLTLNEQITVHALGFDRPSEVVSDDLRMRYQIHRLAAPLRPGESLTLHYDIAYDREGFGNNGRLTAIVDNGSFFNNGDFLPGIGYNPQAELADDDKRKEQKLPPRERMAAIDDERAWQNTYIGHDADWIDFAATVCTSTDQIAIAPGYLQREWTEGDRRCFAYKMDAKILPFYAFMSARYAVLRDKWTPASGPAVDIEIYYQPGHEYNLARMVDGIKKSLDYFTTHFSPYQHRQVRILEFPRYAQFAQAFPNTIPYSESIGFIARVKPDDPEDVDYPFYVTAHEVAHQWWAHQVIGADVQGSTMLSESLAQYSALMVMEKEYGRDKMKRFLAYELRSYLRGRGSERKKELPLALVENQPYIHYNKGSLVFYALRDYIGEDRLNAALARYIKQVAFQPPPFTTTRDLIKILREVTPADQQHLIEDMFETITLFDNKVVTASALPRDGKFVVTLELATRKLRADGLGVETEIPIADEIDVGVFAAPSPGEELGRPLYLERRRFTSNTGTIEIVVDEAPIRVGIDPYNKLIDRNPKDNTAPI